MKIKVWWAVPLYLLLGPFSMTTIELAAMVVTALAASSDGNCWPLAQSSATVLVEAHYYLVVLDDVFVDYLVAVNSLHAILQDDKQYH